MICAREMKLLFDVIDQTAENKRIYPDIFAMRQSNLLVAGFQEMFADSLAQSR
jgi:hypothetical protein